MILEHIVFALIALGSLFLLLFGGYIKGLIGKEDKRFDFSTPEARKANSLFPIYIWAMAFVLALLVFIRYMDSSSLIARLGLAIYFIIFVSMCVGTYLSNMQPKENSSAKIND